MKNNEVKKKNLTMSILYMLCGICWLGSGIYNIKKDASSLIGYVDFGLTAVWILLAIIYFNKYKKGM